MAPPPNIYALYAAPPTREVSKPFPIDGVWLTPLFFGGRADLPATAIPSSPSSVTASRLFPHPPAPLSGFSKIGGVRAGLWDGPLAGPPRRVVPDGTATLQRCLGPA